ncbi:hypothetical protein KAH37_07160 [bacterium]|nr:hypothetical protein [bacterium]
MRLLTTCFLMLFALLFMLSCSSGNKTTFDTDSYNYDSDRHSDTETADSNDGTAQPDKDSDTTDTANDTASDDDDTTLQTDADNNTPDEDSVTTICVAGTVVCSKDELTKKTCHENEQEWIFSPCPEDYYCDSQTLECEMMYITSIDATDKYTRLLKINVVTGEGTELCKSDHITAYNSSTFSRENILYLSASGKLDKMNPSTCEITEIGTTGFKAVPGITSDRNNGIFGIANKNNLIGYQNKLISLDVLTGAGAIIGDLGSSFSTCGATWSEPLKSVYAITAATNKLYIIDPATGFATPVHDLIDEEGDPFKFGSVGIEMHPMNGKIYACSSVTPSLLVIDPETGVVKKVGEGMGHEDPCNNLAAPWKDVFEEM